MVEGSLWKTLFLLLWGGLAVSMIVIAVMRMVEGHSSSPNVTSAAIVAWILVGVVAGTRALVLVLERWVNR